MDWFELAYKFMGGLGVFFFGMKFLSEGLQTIAGTLIKRIINALTSNRLMAVGVGTFVTTLVQSSSITTVMVVGLVNAGLMGLTQAIGVILGANIGTTITGWIIAIQVGKYGLLFVGLGVFPMLFSSRDQFKQIGKILVALGFIFLGLQFMSGAFKPLRSDAGFLHIVQYFSADGFLSLLACIAVGTALTVIIQSSSAMLGVTMALAATGVISFQTSVGLVLGENIGTTITALLASIGANTEAKRAARAHAFFNILGVCVMVPLFWWYVGLVDSMIPSDVLAVGADGSLIHVAAHIAAAHSLFNVTNVLLFLPFLPLLARFVTKITPAPTKAERSHLRHLLTDLSVAPSIALAAAGKEMAEFFELAKDALSSIKDYILMDNPDKDVSDRIQQIENDADILQKDMTVYLCQTQKNTLTYEQSAEAQALIRVADELESITDYCHAIVRYRNRIQENNEHFSEEAKQELREYLDGVVGFFGEIHSAFVDRKLWDVDALQFRLEDLRLQANTIRDSHEQRLNAGQCSPVVGMIFSDIIIGLRKINGHVINVAEAMVGVAQS